MRSVSQALGDLPASSDGTTAAVRYFGGESRTTHYGKQTTVAFAVGASDASAQLPALVLRNIIGGAGSAVAWSTDATASRVGAAVSKTTADSFTVRGFTGGCDNLVGFYATVSSSDVGNAATVAVAVSGVCRLSCRCRMLLPSYSHPNSTQTYTYSRPRTSHC